MKKLISLLLLAVLAVSICGCSKMNDTKPEVNSSEVTQTGEKRYVPFELEPNGIGFVSDAGDVYYHSYRFSTSDRSITYELGGQVNYFLSYKNDMALLAVCSDNIFFRDIEENIIYRAELSDEITENSGKMIFVYDGFASIIGAGENELLLMSNDNTRMKLNTLTGEAVTLEANYLAEFQPFDVSGDYFSFQGYETPNPVTKGGIEIFAGQKDGQPDTLFYNKDNDKVELFSANDIIIDCIIDNAIYFIADFSSESEAFYRLGFSENKGSISDTQLSLVASGYYSVVKGEKNNLIIRQGEFGEYFNFDTATGKKTNTKYNYSADADAFAADIKITEEKAREIALQECRKDKYFDMAPRPTDITADFVELRVDTAYSTGYRNGFVFEDYPWLVYRVTLNSSAYIVTVDVNAQTGKVTFVSASFKD